MTTIVFSHANSFPASTYKVLFKHLRARGFAVKAIEKYGHDPRLPVTNNWPNIVQQLVDFASKVVDKEGGARVPSRPLAGWLPEPDGGCPPPAPGQGRGAG